MARHKSSVRSLDKVEPWTAWSQIDDGLMLSRPSLTMAAALALNAVAACNKADTADEQAADNIEATAENQADVVEMNTDAADAMAAAGQNAAEAIREQGENQADAVRDDADVDGNSAN